MSNTQLMTKSVSVLPDRAGNVFKEQDVITFHISPQSVPVINPRETYLRFYCEIIDLLNLCLSYFAAPKIFTIL